MGAMAGFSALGLPRSNAHDRSVQVASGAAGSDAELVAAQQTQNAGLWLELVWKRGDELESTGCAFWLAGASVGLAQGGAELSLQGEGSCPGVLVVQAWLEWTQ